MADSVETWTGVLQDYRDQLTELLTVLTTHRQNLDDFWDVLWECRDRRLDSQAMIASTPRVSRDPVCGIVSTQFFRRVYENTPDPTDDTMRQLLKTLTKLVRGHEQLESFYRARVQASEEVLQELIASHANPV